MRHFTTIVGFLPVINALISVRIYRQALFYPNSSCSFIGNNTLSGDRPMERCIWQCQNEVDCQTVMYNHQKKICTMYGENCETGRVVFDGNSIEYSVICSEKNYDKSKVMRTCSSTLTTSVLETTVSDTSPPLQIFWSFDGHFNDFYDVYNGTGMNNCSFHSPGYTGYGSALSLNRSRSQYVMISKFLNMTYISFTWELWAFPTNLENFDHLMIGMCQFPNTSNCMHLMIRNNTSYFAFWGNDCINPTIIPVDQWHHFAFVYDYEKRIKYIYLNGQLICIQTSSEPFQGNAGQLIIGAINKSNAPSDFWFGHIDQVSYISRVKSVEEILTDATLVAYYSFDQESLLDFGPNKINGTGVNILSSEGRVNDSLLFNNSLSYFQATGFTLLGASYRSYSIALWIYRLASTNINGTILHLSQYSNGLGWCVPIIGFTSSYQIVAQSLSQNMTVQSVVGLTLPVKSWTHVVTSYNSTNGLRLWLNGTLVNSSAAFAYGASNTPNTITIGSSLNGSSCLSELIGKGQFYGMIDELKIFSRELNASDIAELYNIP